MPPNPWASQVAQWSRTCLPMQELQEAWVRSLGWEDPLEKEIGNLLSIVAREIPWTEEPGRQQWGQKQSDTTEWLSMYKSMGPERAGHSWVTKHTCMQTWAILNLGLTVIAFWVDEDQERIVLNVSFKKQVWFKEKKDHPASSSLMTLLLTSIHILASLSSPRLS